MIYTRKVKKGNCPLQRGRRRTLELLKRLDKKEYVIGVLEDVLENLFELLRKDTLHTLCALM